MNENILTKEEFFAKIDEETKKMPDNWRKGQKVFNAIDIIFGVAREVTYNRSPKQQCKKVINGKLFNELVIAQDNGYDNVQIIPYLFPMNKISSLITAKELSTLSGYELIDWYNANHVDYRGLIEKGLAIKATTDMYTNK